MGLKIYKSNSFDPYFNLAFEEYLVHSQLKMDDMILYLWQNDKTVVVGKNQNVYMECNLDYAKYNGIRIARRLSGGGSVYHDLGNLNYTIVSPNESFSKSFNLSILINALQNLGINAVESGRNDIAVNGKKISGTAFFHGVKNSFQHGCIIFDVNLKNMENVLLVKEDKIKTKGIRSIKARVATLKDFVPDIDLNIISNSIIKNVIGFSNKKTYIIDKLDIKEIKYDIELNTELKKLIKKYSSDEWIFGRKIPMQYQLYRRFSWGDCNINIDSDCNVIENILIYSDALEVNVFDYISNELKGISFKKNIIIKKMKGLIDYQIDETWRMIICDITKLMREELMIYDG